MSRLIILIILLIGLSLLIINLINTTPKIEEVLSDKNPILNCGIESPSPESDLGIGKTLFKSECATCHNKNMKDLLTGPALSGVINRWKNDTTSLINYIKDQKLYFHNKPSKRMITLHKKFGSYDKPINKHFDDKQIKAILIYIERPNIYL